MLRATLNEPVPLQVFIPAGTPTLFVRARVIDAAGTVVTTLQPLHQTLGLYAVTWTPAAEGYYSAVYDLFLDDAFTIPADYERDAEIIEVSSDKTNITRLLGLHHENSLLDQQTYNNSRLVSARLRMYNSAANLAAAAATSPVGGTTGLLFTWVVTATYDGGNQAQTFQIARSV